MADTPVDNETRVIEYQLNSRRMSGEIDFTGNPETYEQNGNVYVEVECTGPEAASGVRAAFEEILDDERIRSFRGPDVKNPSTESRYVYVVAEPPFGEE